MWKNMLLFLKESGDGETGTVQMRWRPRVSLDDDV